MLIVMLQLGGNIVDNQCNTEQMGHAILLLTRQDSFINALRSKFYQLYQTFINMSWYPRSLPKYLSDYLIETVTPVILWKAKDKKKRNQAVERFFDSHNSSFKIGWQGDKSLPEPMLTQFIYTYMWH